ncbi:hypothetical protein HDU96_003545 [Phlyctochytrium bullatum]|nr:hypothetical protein HDU96_003545 [Phlyctochytrium bullatum]
MDTFKISLQILSCYGRAGRFAEAETILKSLESSHSALEKKSADERILNIKARKAAKEANRLQHENKILNELQLPVAIDYVKHRSTSSSQGESNSKTPLPSIVESFIPGPPLLVLKPPLPRDAPKALIRRRAELRPRSQLGKIQDAYNALLYAYARGGHKEACDNLLDRMKANGPSPNNESYSAAMVAALVKNDYARVFDLDAEATQSGVHWSRYLNNHVLEAAVASSDAAFAKKVLDDMKRKSELYATRGMKGPDSYTLLSVIKIAGLARDAEAAWTAFAHLLKIHDRKVSPWSVLGYLAMATSALDPNASSDATLKIWNAQASYCKLKSPSLSLYRYGALGYASLGDIYTVEAFIQAFEVEAQRRLETLEKNTPSFQVEASRLKSACQSLYSETLCILTDAFLKPDHLRQLPLVPKADAAAPVLFFETIATKRKAPVTEKETNLLLRYICQRLAFDPSVSSKQLAKGLILLMIENKLHGELDTSTALTVGFGETSEVVELYKKTIKS